jgi:hypothetical protein
VECQQLIPVVGAKNQIGEARKRAVETKAWLLQFGNSPNMKMPRCLDVGNGAVSRVW